MKRASGIGSRLVLVASVGAALVSCGGGKPPPAAKVATNEPHWQDALDSIPELLVVVRPKAIKQDRIYGPLFKRAVAAARDHNKVVAATHPLETIEDAEEVVAGIHPAAPDSPGEIILVERGVRSDVDPSKLVDDDGQALWTAGPSGMTTELVREKDEHGQPVDASLFELPGRTWVVVTGPARARARSAFAHPFARPPLDLEPGALALVRIDGPSLVSRQRALQDLGTFAAVGRRLKFVTFALPPGGEGAVKATLTYADEDAAAFAQVAIQEVVAAVVRTKNERMAWLATAKVDRPDRRVVVTAPLPPRLVEGLLGAGTAPLDLESPGTITVP